MNECTTSIATTTTTTTTTEATTSKTSTTTPETTMTQTTRLDAMLFNSKPTEPNRLEGLLFTGPSSTISNTETSPRLPKTASKDIDIIEQSDNKVMSEDSSTMADDNNSVDADQMLMEETSTTETMMKISTSVKAVDYFEYVESNREEDAKYLEMAIGKNYN